MAGTTPSRSRVVSPATAATASTYPLQKTLGGVAVKLTQNGVSVDALPIFAVSGQVNFIVPSNARLGANDVTITYNGQGATCAPSTVLVDGKPPAVVCSRSEQATTDATGSAADATGSGTSSGPNTGPHTLVATDPAAFATRAPLPFAADGSTAAAATTVSA